MFSHEAAVLTCTSIITSVIRYPGPRNRRHVPLKNCFQRLLRKRCSHECGGRPKILSKLCLGAATRAKKLSAILIHSTSFSLCISLGHLLGLILLVAKSAFLFR